MTIKERDSESVTLRAFNFLSHIECRLKHLTSNLEDEYKNSLKILLVSYEEISNERLQMIKDLEEEFEIESWTPEKKYETAVDQYYFLLDERGIHAN